MDFTKFLKHCEAEHGIHVDTSAFTKEILNSIFAFFAAHGEILTHTQLWDIFETLQERPKPGNPPPIVALMKGRAEENIKCGEPMESASWYSQEGVLLSNADALKIVEFCERANAPEQLPDYGTGFRPPPIVAEMKQRAFEYIGRGEPTGLASWRDEYGVLLSNEQALQIVEFCERANAPEQLPDYGTGFRPPWDVIGPEYVACAVDRNGIVYFYNKIPKAYEFRWNNGDFDDDSFYCADYPFSIKSPVENWRECLWIRPGHQQQ